MEALVSVISAVNRPTKDKRIFMETLVFLTMKGNPCDANSASWNALPPVLNVHCKVTFSPSTTCNGFEGADIIFGACDSKRQKKYAIHLDHLLTLNLLFLGTLFNYISYPWRKLETHLLRVQIEIRKTAQKYGARKETSHFPTAWCTKHRRQTTGK